MFASCESESDLHTGSALELWLAATELHMRRGLAAASEIALEQSQGWADGSSEASRGDWVLKHGA